MARTLTFQEALDRWMEDPAFRAEYEALEPAFQATCLRIERGLTQAQLAALMGTKQPNIARFESGRQDPRLSFLRRLADALGCRLEVRMVPKGGDQ